MFRTTLQELKIDKLITDNLVLGTSSTPLQYYEEFVHSTSMQGPFASPIPVDVRITKVGNVCTLVIDPVVGAHSMNSRINMTDALPERFRPKVTGGLERIIVRILIMNNSTISEGTVYIFATGAIRVSNAVDINFNTGGNCGFQDGITVTYLTE